MSGPEARAALRRWGEALAGLGLLLLGLRWMGSMGLLIWVGAAVAALGAAVAFTGVQRARRARGGEAPGVVRVDEARVLYLGPREGGMADLDALLSIAVEPGGAEGPVWVLGREGGGALRVPARALGAEALLDAFAALPGFQAARALAALQGDGMPVEVWRRRARGSPERAAGALPGARGGSLPPGPR